MPSYNFMQKSVWDLMSSNESVKQEKLRKNIENYFHFKFNINVVLHPLNRKASATHRLYQGKNENKEEKVSVAVS